MGLSSKKQTSNTDPTAYAKPYISAAGSALGDAFSAAQPVAAGIGSTLASQLPSFADRAFTPSAGIAAATDYNTKVLNGGFLGSNPYLGRALADSSNDVTDRVQSAFGAAGRTGSGANTLALAKGISSAQNTILAGEYDSERQRQAQAAALAPVLSGAQYDGLGAYLTAAQAAVGIPQQAAGNYASGLGSIFGRYTNQQQTYNPSLMDNIGQAINIGKSVAGLF